MHQRTTGVKFPEPIGDRDVVRDEIERLKRRERDLRAGLRHLVGMNPAPAHLIKRLDLQQARLGRVQTRIYRLQQRSLL